MQNDPDQGQPPGRPHLQLLQQVAIVLVAPRYPENIGAASRIAANMGIGQLIVVSREAPDQERMRKTATHHTAHLLDAMRIFPDLGTALSPFGWVVGTSARQGRQRRLLTSPRKMAAELLPKLAGNRAALLFGPEDCGLTNDDLRFCNMVTCIPTADFSSLNLAQAVAIICHEVHTAALQQQSAAAAGPKLAESRELESMYGRIELTLRTMNALQEAEYGYWMHNIRNFLSRVGLRSREVKLIRGFCRQVMGLAERPPSAGQDG
jgi:tRNA/rRNA methyltransferase